MPDLTIKINLTTLLLTVTSVVGIGAYALSVIPPNHDDVAFNERYCGTHAKIAQTSFAEKQSNGDFSWSGFKSDSPTEELRKLDDSGVDYGKNGATDLQDAYDTSYANCRRKIDPLMRGSVAHRLVWGIQKHFQ